MLFARNEVFRGLAAKTLCIACGLLLLIATAGCATNGALAPKAKAESSLKPASEPASESVPKASPMPPMNERVGDSQAAEREVEAASKMVDSSGTSSVIPKLLNVISKYPGTNAAYEARYWLARAYYKIGGYRDAIDLFKEYVRLAPDGRYVQESNAFVQRLTTEYSQRFLPTAKLDENIQTLTNELAKSPDNIGTQLALADLYWKKSDYDKAAEIYKNLVDKHPDQKSNDIIRQRMDFQDGGKFTVLTPVEIKRRQVEAQPLAVINTASFQGGKDLLTREPRFYSVTGQVVNQLQQPLNGVQVVITIFGFGNVVYDTTTVNIGKMNPSEIRAFSARFSNLSNIDNVNRYECVATFQR
jgi:tetratricopeptide (TPR) repeat protein